MKIQSLSIHPHADGEFDEVSWSFKQFCVAAFSSTNELKMPRSKTIEKWFHSGHPVESKSLKAPGCQNNWKGRYFQDSLCLEAPIKILSFFTCLFCALVLLFVNFFFGAFRNVLWTTQLHQLSTGIQDSALLGFLMFCFAVELQKCLVDCENFAPPLTFHQHGDEQIITTFYFCRTCSFKPKFRV